MKYTIAFIICILAGIIIGWHFGRAHAITEHQRSLEAQIVTIDRQRAEYYKTAKPWVTGTAEIALAGLKSLDTNDTADAKYRLAELVGLYYRDRSNDGSTNLLLADIEAFAAKDLVLSNEIYGKQ
jgi:hypothetical protein